MRFVEIDGTETCIDLDRVCNFWKGTRIADENRTIYYTLFGSDKIMQMRLADRQAANAVYRMLKFQVKCKRLSEMEYDK